MKNEQTYEWLIMSGSLKEMTIAAHLALKTTKKVSKSEKQDILNRCFDLGNPKIVFGENFSYCRIHADSVDVMKVILNNYFL